ncbi:hypothetical protein [uncultured Sulfitobacter sp.]|uniref:hypothetical protein n=1 Tax=uncultured Sulfitobacter sp. TaxID=191468 RepID=UPI0026260260|nr:hypothetical protein [uncultured Sulfitobacter sp.]
MSFAETYREERLINRRSRARKARIAGRVIGFGLTACLMVALRTDPQLRAMVQDVTMAAVGASMPDSAGQTANAQSDAIRALGYAQGSDEARALETLGISDSAAPQQPTTARMPQSRVKINRPGSG